MKIYHIGTIANESSSTKRELKSIGGISGYILELINYSLLKNIKIGFIGKIYNYKKSSGINYIQVQKKVTSTNKFLINLFIKSLFFKIPYDAIIHAHRPDHLAALALLKRRKSIITLHGQQAHTVNIRKNFVIRYIYKSLEKFAFKKAHVLIAVDHITEQFYSNLYPHYSNKFITIPTGVNSDLFYPDNKANCRKSLMLNKEDKIIIYIGRIEPPKKVDVILKAFQLLNEKDKSYKLILVGGGVSLEQIKALAVELNIQEHVLFLGVRKRIELQQLYSAADVSVLISGNEGSPLSIKESLACGVPVVANNVGDVTKVIENNDNGYIVNSDNINEICEKLELTISQSNNMKDKCISSVEKYSIKNVSDKIIEIYKKLLDE